MNWVDILCGLILAAGAYLGFKKGAVGSFVSISSYATAVFMAVALYAEAGDFIKSHVNMPVWLARVIGFVIVFVIVFLVIRVAGLLLGKLTRLAVPGLDKAGGVIFGFVVACFLITVLAVLVFEGAETGLRSTLAKSSILRFIVHTVSRLLSV